MGSARRDSDLWWVIPGELAGMRVPFIHPDRHASRTVPVDAFDDDLAPLHAAGVRAIVSLLDWGYDGSVYEAAGISFRSVPVRDGFPPTIQQARAIVQFVRQQISQKRPVAIHCMAGMGRTGTAVAAYLIAQGESVSSAVARVRSARPGAIETPMQMQFLEQFSRVCAQQPKK